MAFGYATAFSRNIGWLTEEEQERLRHKRVAMPIDGTLLHAVRGRGRSRHCKSSSVEVRSGGAPTRFSSMVSHLWQANRSSGGFSDDHLLSPAPVRKGSGDRVSCGLHHAVGRRTVGPLTSSRSQRSCATTARRPAQFTPR
jgi:hypothetical protein